MLKILKYLKWQEWLCALLCVGLITGQVWIDLKLPDYLQEVITLATYGGEMREIWINGGWMMACAFGSLASAIVVGYISARISTSFGARLRGNVFDRTLGFSMEEINHFSTSSLITRTTNDVGQVQMFLSMGFQIMIKAPILATWAIIKISTKNWQWMLTTGVAVSIILALVLVILIFAMPKFRKMQSLIDNLNRETRENLTGLRVIRSFNAAKFGQDKFEKANDEITRTQLFTSRIMAMLSPVMSLIMMGMSLAIYWLGAHIIENAGLAEKGVLFADMTVFMAYAMQVIMSFIMLIMIFFIMPRAIVAAGRINKVLYTKPTITNGTKTQGEEGKEGEVEFVNVSFKYPDASEAIINNVSFKAKKGETVAFIGSTGSGKSTLINLVPRFYDATDGEVLVDGVNVKDYTLEALRSKLGYVAQKAVIFTGTVKENIAFGENGKPVPTQEEIESAAAIAQATEFIENMEEKYESYIAQGGTNISGGQKQRLAIARAIAKKPEIYIFDDSFSALDYKTDRVLRSALKEKTAGATCLIVGQRIGTIRDADKIIVLDEGNVVGIGTHKKLMKDCQVYQEIALSQLSKEELEND